MTLNRFFPSPRGASLVVLLAGALFAFACMPPAHAFGVKVPDTANPLAGSSDAARKGEELFGRNCQQCHNTRGHGGKCPQLVRGAWGPGGANSDAFMHDIIANGRAGTQMGAFGAALGAEEIWQIVAFLREEAVRVKAADKAHVDDEEDLWY